MYTEGFDELSEAESRPSRTYVSPGGQDSLKLQRENERLRKSLEKEQFFNRLLDQELKDLKASLEAGLNGEKQYTKPEGVSRRAFNILLVITFVLAAFAVYAFLNRNQPALFPSGGAPGASAKPAPVTDSVPTIIARKKSLPEIVGKQNIPATGKPAAENRTAANTPDRTAANNTRENRARQRTEATEQPAATQAATDDQASTNQAATNQPAAAPVESVPVTSAAPTATAPVERPVVGKYIVTSKANFYSAPDENTLRSYFISPGSDKVVNALEEKNGFIYVEFKNDVGYVTKGWLSKADLTKQ